MEGDAALGFPNKVIHMRSSGPGPNPLSVGVGGQAGQNPSPGSGGGGRDGQQGWEASGLGPMRRMPAGAFGSWLLPS